MTKSPGEDGVRIDFFDVEEQLKVALDMLTEAIKLGPDGDRVHKAERKFALRIAFFALQYALSKDEKDGV